MHGNLVAAIIFPLLGIDPAFPKTFRMKGCARVGRDDRDADGVRLISLNQVIRGNKGFTGLLRKSDNQKEMKTDAEPECVLTQMGQHRDRQAFLPLP